MGCFFFFFFFATVFGLANKDKGIVWTFTSGFMRSGQFAANSTTCSRSRPKCRLILVVTTSRDRRTHNVQ